MKKGVFKMTADAKVGLLLGLFFIVVIAFLVNGLPNFIEEEKPSPPGAAIITPTGPDMPLDNRVSDAVHRLYPPRVPARTKEPAKVEIVSDVPPAIPVQVDAPEVILPSKPSIVNDPPAVNPVVVESCKERIHLVKAGENLPAIAKMYYGDEEGNRRMVIQKLYQANTSVLKSPDRICVGDQLVIPSLDALLDAPHQVVRAPDPSQTLLSKFSNVLERVGKDSAKSVSEYEVQAGESLWSIAKDKLGDGNRYKEILQLNQGTIKNENNVGAGTRLKLPSQ
jgi:nucleoid-associated protein YgaU